MANKGIETLRQFTLGKAKSGGRNSHGRITAFHRGGGAKRLLRRIDLKRSVPGVGIVERIEYDPNRSSKIALVRWIEGGIPRCRQDRRESAVEAELASLREKVLGSATASCDGGGFSFSSLPGKVRRTRIGGIFASMLSSSSQKAKDGEGSLVGLPRMAVAGAKPAFFAARTSGKEGGEAVPLSEVRTWKPESRIWTQRNKRRAAIPWQSVRHHSSLGVSGTSSLSGTRKGLGQILEATSHIDF